MPSDTAMRQGVVHTLHVNREPHFGFETPADDLLALLTPIGGGQLVKCLIGSVALPQVAGQFNKNQLQRSSRLLSQIISPCLRLLSV